MKAVAIRLEDKSRGVSRVSRVNYSHDLRQGKENKTGQKCHFMSGH